MGCISTPTDWNRVPRSLPFKYCITRLATADRWHELYLRQRQEYVKAPRFERVVVSGPKHRSGKASGFELLSNRESEHLRPLRRERTGQRFRMHRYFGAPRVPVIFSSNAATAARK